MTATDVKKAKKQEISKTSVSKRDADMFEPHNYNPVKGEMALWTAVITQALMDAGSESRKPDAQHEKAKAIRWLLGNSEDFVTVCQNAGLDPDNIRRKALSAIERGCVWRQGMAEQRKKRLQTKQHIPLPPANQPRPQHIDYSRALAGHNFYSATMPPMRSHSLHTH